MNNLSIELVGFSYDFNMLCLTPDSSDFNELDICFSDFLDWMIENDNFDFRVQNDKNGFVFVYDKNIYGVTWTYELLSEVLNDNAMFRMVMQEDLLTYVTEYIQEGDFVWEEKDYCDDMYEINMAIDYRKEHSF